VSWIEAAIEEMSDTLAGKNEDYRIDGEFSNFELAGKVSGVDANVVMLTQIGIKMGRLMGLKDDPNNESYKDSVKDLAGYALIMYGYLLSQEASSPESTPEAKPESFAPPRLNLVHRDSNPWPPRG